jgi:hypothetical protein
VISATNVFDPLVNPLLTTFSIPSALRNAYCDYISAILASRLWSSTSTFGLRIPWRQANSAAKHAASRNAFGSPGLYLFGSDLGIPLYVGMTKGPLWSRLRKRYVCGHRSQCQLAVDYEHELISRGLDGFPDDVREWYRKGYGTSTVRLKGAVAFARSGIEGIWFTLLPVSDPDTVRSFERALIPAACEWNSSRGYPLLLNAQNIE